MFLRRIRDVSQNNLQLAEKQRTHIPDQKRLKNEFRTQKLRQV